jgi:hypothetical protein
MSAETHGVLQAKCPLFILPILTKPKGSTYFSKPDWYKKIVMLLRLSTRRDIPVPAEFEVATALVMNCSIFCYATMPCNPLSNVAYRPVAKRSFLGNGSVNTILFLGSTELNSVA